MTNSIRRIIISFSIFLFLFSTLSSATSSKTNNQFLVYIGTYTEDGSDSKGIYAYRFDQTSARLTPLGLAAKSTNPSFLAIHPNHRFVYAVNEIKDFDGKKSGAVSAYTIDQATGKLTLLNQLATGGSEPCYISLDKTGKFVLVANYGGGSIAVFPVLEDGRLDKMATFIQHSGHGPNAQRQEGPHAHSIDLSPDNRFALVDDLGLDQTLVYEFGDKAPLSPDTRLKQMSAANSDPGAGPRHLAFAPNGKSVYVLNEMQSAVSAFHYNAATGTLERFQTISSLPRNFSKENTAAEIEIHPSGKFLYASNRGNDSIAVFAINASTGKLTPIEYPSTKGSSPRNFEISPDGSLLFAANEKSDNIVVFRINRQTGRLTPTGKVLDIAQPVCVKFVPMD